MRNLYFTIWQSQDELHFLEGISIDVAIDVAQHQMPVIFHCHQFGIGLPPRITIAMKARTTVKLWQVTRTDTIEIRQLGLEGR